MRKVAVVGAGCTRFSGAQPRTSTELFSEASLEALQQSGLKNTDIDAMLIGVAFSDYTEGQQIVHSFASENLGLDHVATNTYDGGCASSTAALRDAYIWIASGFYDAILVGGVEKAASMGTKLATQVYSMYSDRYFEYPTGITFPGVFAMLVHLYASKYNIEISKLKEYMAQVSVKAHKFGVKNNKAHLQRELTVEKVFRSPMVCQPLQVYDCSPFSDGASAVVLVSEDLSLIHI